MNSSGSDRDLQNLWTEGQERYTTDCAGTTGPMHFTYNQRRPADLPIRPKLGSIADRSCAGREKHLWKDGGGRPHPWTEVVVRARSSDFMGRSSWGRLRDYLSKVE